MTFKFDMPDEWCNNLKNWFPKDINFNELAEAMFVNRLISKGICDEFGEVIPFPSFDLSSNGISINELRDIKPMGC